jgi:hypothetical protein
LQGGTGATTAPAALANLGGLSSTTALAALAPLTPAADRLPYFTSGSAAAVAPLTAFARTILDDADAAAVRTTIGAQAALGFTPVEQGGGAFMGTNKVRLGWEESTGGVLLQIDATTLGLIALRHEIPTWANTMGTVAAQPMGGVGTYALLRHNSGANQSPGNTLPGSNLFAATAGGDMAGSPSGTWRVMGWVGVGTGPSMTSLWLRIA